MVAAALLAAFSARGAWAGDAPAAAPSASATAARRQASAAFRSGSAHYKLHEYGEALEDFKRAYRLAPEPVILLDIGQCYRGLGDPQRAASFFRQYLRERPQADDRDTVEQLIAELERAAVPAPTPAPTPPPAPVEVAPAPAAPLVLSAPPLRPQRRPLVKKAWFWSVIGVGVVVAAGSVALGLTYGSTGPHATGCCVQGP